MSRTVPPRQDRRPSSEGSSLPGSASHRPGLLDVFVLSAWCGLAAGLLEVAVRVSWRLIHPGHSLYLMSRHFVWSAPLANLLLFSVAGLFLGGATRLWPRRGGWLSLRLIGFCAVLPAISLSSARIYPLARVLLALGIAMVLARSIESHLTGLRRRLLWSFPALLALVAASAGSVFGGDWLKQGREARCPLPPAGSPNVLLVVLDTVRADRLSLYGYERHDQSPPPAPGPPRNPVRRGTGDGTLDARIARQLVHRPMAPSARRGLDDSRSMEFPDPGGLPGLRRLRDCGFCRERPLLLLRHPSGSGLYPLRRLCLRAIRPHPDGLARRPRPANCSPISAWPPVGARSPASSAPCRVPCSSRSTRWIVRKMRGRSTGNSWAGCRGARSHRVLSSRSSITTTPMHLTCSPPGALTASGSRLRIRPISWCLSSIGRGALTS